MNRAAENSAGDIMISQERDTERDPADRGGLCGRVCTEDRKREVTESKGGVRV